jgi:hypothetical protein
MLEPYHLAPVSLRLPPAHRLPALTPAITHRYQLVALLLAEEGGGQRPALGLRRQLPCSEHRLSAPEPALRQAQATRPFVLRARPGDRIETQVTNLLPRTPLGLALVDDDYAILETDAPEIMPGETCTCIWHCRHAGIYPIYNRACSDPVERRNLLGVLIIEPQ